MIKNRNINHIHLYYLWMIVYQLVNLIMNICIYLNICTSYKLLKTFSEMHTLGFATVMYFIASYYIFIVFYVTSSTWHILFDSHRNTFWLGQVVLCSWYEWKNHTLKRAFELLKFTWIISRRVRNRSSDLWILDPVLCALDKKSLRVRLNTSKGLLL